MSVVTEAALRVQLKDADLEAMKEYRVDEGVIVTPSARAWLVDNKIDLIVGDKRTIKNPEQGGDKPAAFCGEHLPQPDPGRYEGLYGGVYDKKPEHMTALRKNLLVFKDHKVIRLRGRLDSLIAKTLEVQLAFDRLELKKGTDELSEVLGFIREILRREVLEQPLGPIKIFGMDEAELKSRSHHPQKYYGIPHFSASVDDGEAVVRLNLLRTASREAELAAYDAFKQENGEPLRPDIVTALNRMSSVFYVMMLKAKAGEYET